MWGHETLHAATLIRLIQTNYHKLSPLQLVMSQQPNIFHQISFDCVVHVSVTPANRTKMWLQRRLEINFGFESPSIIFNLEPFERKHIYFLICRLSV